MAHSKTSSNGETDEQTDPPTIADPDNVTANERVLLVSGNTHLMHSPRLIEAETSSTGKTILVTDSTGRSYQLKPEKIFNGDSEIRGATYFELYTRETLQKKQRVNNAPGPQAGANGVQDIDEMPKPTHVLPSDDDAEEKEKEGEDDGTEYAEGDRVHARSETDTGDVLDARGTVETVTDSKTVVSLDDGRTVTQRGDYLIENADKRVVHENAALENVGESDDYDCSVPTQTESDGLDEGSDKWDLSQYSRGTVLLLDTRKGAHLVVNRKKTQFGDVLALDVLGPNDELLRLQKVSLGETYFDARPATCEGGRIREKGGATVVKNVENINDIRDFEATGVDEPRLRQWVRETYYGE